MEKIGLNSEPSFRELRRRMGYPDVEIPANRSWYALDPDYAPVEYTAPSVKKHVPDWHTPDVEAVWQRTKALSSCDTFFRDARTGLPLNPAGPTGVCGYGRLRMLGPNLTGDGIVTYGEGDDTQLLLITRTDTDQLAFPGGFSDQLADGSYEHPLQTALREIWEETSISLKTGRITLLHAGIAALSLRNTDNAWIENTAYHIHVPAEVGRTLVPRARDDAKAASWYNLHDVDLAKMSDTHAENAKRLALTLADLK